jgi:hypothetical protein
MLQLEWSTARAARPRRPVSADRIRFQVVPMEALSTVLGTEVFDGVYSNFGAVNCAPDLAALAGVLAPRLAPNAALVWVIMGRFVPWEMGWYLLRGDGRRAFRRFRRAGSEWRGLTIHYPTPGYCARLLDPYFIVSVARPLGVILPPSYAAGWLERAPRMRAWLVAPGARIVRAGARSGPERSLRARSTPCRMKTVRAFWVLLPPQLRRRCLALLGLALVMAATTVAGLVSVMPFFQLLSASEATPTTRWLQGLRATLGIADERVFLGATGVVFVLTLIVANVINYFGVAQHARLRAARCRRHPRAALRRLLAQRLSIPHPSRWRAPR